METVIVSWEVNVTSGNETINLEELECETMEEWNELDESEQRERLQIAIDDIPPRTCMIVDKWS